MRAHDSALAAVHRHQGAANFHRRYAYYRRAQASLPYMRDDFTYRTRKDSARQALRDAAFMRRMVRRVLP